MVKASHYRVNKSIGGDIFIFIILSIFAIFMALPLVYTVVSAFKPLEEIFIFPPRFFVRNPTLDNFVMLNKNLSELWVPLERYIFNSLFISVVATAAHVILASMAAYPLAKHNFPGKNLLFAIVMLALLFNQSVTAIPQYIVMAKVGMINTYWSLILPAIASSLGLFLMKQFIESIIPDAMLESARIEGASEFSIFFRVVMPLVKPAWMTLIIFAFQGIWGQTGTTYVYDEALKVLPCVLQQIVPGGIARMGVGAAAGLLMIIPPIITFIITQSNVIQTMAHSGIKE